MYFTKSNYLKPKNEFEVCNRTYMGYAKHACIVICNLCNHELKINNNDVIISNYYQTDIKVKK
jgi:hypothetical protein